jgi:hypothetical protein
MNFFLNWISRSCFILFAILTGCNNSVRLESPEQIFSGVFGIAPDSDDLESIFLALPDLLAADMSVEGRMRFMEIAKADTVNHRFDPRYRYIQYFSDGNEGTGATSMFYLKVFPSVKHKYLVFVHVLKPLSKGVKPGPQFTHILAPQDGKWLDVTDQFLPENVERFWYFQPIRRSNIVEAGQYINNREIPGKERITLGDRTVDLVFENERFRAVTASTAEYTEE